jgi:hypothetical protein
MLTKEEEKAAKAKGREKYKDYIRDEPYHNLKANNADLLCAASATCGGLLSGLFTTLACKQYGIDPQLPAIAVGLAAGVASGRPLFKEANFQRYLAWLASRDYA